LLTAQPIHARIAEVGAQHEQRGWVSTPTTIPRTFRHAVQGGQRLAKCKRPCERVVVDLGARLGRPSEQIEDQACCTPVAGTCGVLHVRQLVRTQPDPAVIEQMKRETAKPSGAACFESRPHAGRRSKSLRSLDAIVGVLDDVGAPYSA